MAFMSVRHWGPPGMWDTNFNQFASSGDNGQHWTTADAPRWPNNSAGDDPFQMVAFEQRGGYVYMFGTPNGRLGNAHVARAPARQMLSKKAWRYWNGTAWAKDEVAAAPVVTAHVAELSVRYNEYSGSWLMMYLQDSDIVLRSAPSSTRPWSAPQVAVSSAD